MTLSNNLEQDPVPSPQDGLARHRIRRAILFLSAGSALIFLFMAIALFGLLHNMRLHRYMLLRAEQQASDAFGVQVQLQDFKLDLSGLGLDLYGLTVIGAKPYPNPPLLQVEHVQVSLKIISFFRRQWYLDTLRVDHPVVRVFTDAQGGTNIPVLKSSGNSSNTSLFDLGVRHAVLEGGQAYYNNKETDLQAELQNLKFTASFDPRVKKYSGRLRYFDGRLSSGSLQQIPHSLHASFEATPDGVRLSDAQLVSGSSQLSVAGELKNYSHPEINASYDASLDAGQFQQLLKNPSIPAGTVRASGTAHYHHLENTAALASLTVKGLVHSDELRLNSPTFHAEATHLLGHYTLENGEAVLQDFQLDLLGGNIQATGKVTGLTSDLRYQAQAALHHLSLPEITRAAHASAMPAGTALAGSLSGTLTANGTKTLDDLIATADLNATAGIDKTATHAASQAIPVNSIVHAKYMARGGELALTKSYVRTPETALTLDGTVSSRSNLNVDVAAKDLHEIERIAAIFQPPSPNVPSPLALTGVGSFKGVVHGTTTEPRLTGRLSGENISVRGTTIRHLQSAIDLSPTNASISNADVRLASHGHIGLDAQTALSQWSFLQTSPLKVRLAVSDLNLADVGKIAGSQIPVSGTLDANVDVYGTALSPQGRGTASLAKVVAYQQPIDSARFVFAGSGDEVHGDLTLRLLSGEVLSRMSVHPRNKTYRAELSASELHMDQLQAVKSKSLVTSGVLSAQATGQGSFDDPGLDASLTIPQLVLQGQKFANSTLHLNVANHLANANLDSNGIGTSIRATAKIALDGDYPADVSLDTQSVPLQPILAVYAPSQAAEVSGQTELHATLHGPLKDKELLEAHVVIPALKMAYGKDVQLAAVAPIRIDYKDNIVSLQRSALKGTDTDLQLQASFPLRNNPPISALLRGTINLQLAQIFDPDIRTGGELKFDINSYDTPGAGNIGGEIDVVDASYSSDDLPVGLQHGNGVITLTRDRLNIARFEAEIGGGTVTAQGGVGYQPSVQFDLGVATKGVRMLYPQGMREGVDANLRLTGSPDAALLAGSVNLSDMSFTPAFDLTNFIGQFSGGISAPPTQGFSQNLQLQIALRSTNDVNLVGRTLSINGSANLQVRGTAADPVILGRVNLNNGDVILNGERFVLNGGTIEFVNPSETQPVVNLSLNTTIQEYNVYLRFNGPIDQLRTNYSSDPALPSADIINLLAFGKTTEANSANPSTPANQAAESLIASQVSSQLTSRVSKIAGISQLSISPVLSGGTSQGPPGANLTVQQRVTGNLFVTFSSNLASTQNQTIQGQYQLTPNIAVSGTRDQNGGFAVDALVKKNW